MKSQIRLGRAAWNAAVAVLILVAMEPAESRGQSSENDALRPVAFGPEKGTLVICGGGILPEALRTKVLELAEARMRLVVISTASQTADTPEIETYVAWWRQQKLAEMTILHTRSRELADTERFVEPLTAQPACGSWVATKPG